LDNTSGKISKLNGFREKANTLLAKYWFLINLLFIIGYSVYIIFKLLNGRKSFLYKNVDSAVTFSFVWFIVNLTGYGIILFSFFSKVKFKIRQFTVILFTGFLILIFGSLMGSDSGLNWEGSDVAVGNYISAEEGVRYGVFDLIKNWNDHLNPYNRNYSFGELSDSVRLFIEKYNLQGISFDKWKTTLDSSKYDLIVNNRPLIHPPLTPVAIALWLDVFPFGRWSAEMLMITFTLLSVLLVIFLAYRKGINNFSLMIILSLISSPVLIRFQSPSTDQMSMLMFSIPVFLFLLYPSKKFGTAFLYGIIYGLCFYTKFIVVLFIFVMIIFLFIYYKKLSFRFVLGFLLGLLVPVIIMTSLGYYFWLTLITGQILANINNANSDISILNLILKLLYYGPSFLLLFIYLMINSNKLNKNLLFFFIPVVISIFLTMAAAPAVWNRYLIHFMPSVLLFLLSINIQIEFKKRDLIISFLANLIFFQLNNYF
jgi:hypothetical protein